MDEILVTTMTMAKAAPQGVPVVEQPQSQPADGWKPATEKEYDDFRALVMAPTDGWTLVSQKPGCTTLVSKVEGSDIVRVKVVAEAFEGIAPETLYDVLLDPEYRKTWDDNMVESKTIERIDRYNEISYYSARLPTPLSGRDWVLKCATTIRQLPGGAGREFIICNRSVLQRSCPPKKNFVRATSFSAGYLIRPTSNGCCLWYTAHNEWAGWIPPWVVNFAMKKVAPSVVDTLVKVCKEYPTWKASHNPDEKPWLPPLVQPAAATPTTTPAPAAS